MQSLYVIKTNHLTTDELNVLEKLAQTCDALGGPISKLYWDAMKQQRAVAGNLLCYRENNLVGYFGFFLFDEKVAHVSAIVQLGDSLEDIFLHLFRAASAELMKLGIHQMIFSCKKENEMAKKCLALLGSQFLEFEYHMERVGDCTEIIPPHALLIRKAEASDVALIAKIDASCFGSDYAIMLQRFKDIIKDPHRSIWLAYLKEKGIGKAHIRFHKERAFIHDVGILPAEQEKGYGTLLLKSIINHLVINKRCDFIELEVLATNESALQLYKTCHFDIISAFENWQVTW